MQFPSWHFTLCAYESRRPRFRWCHRARYQFKWILCYDRKKEWNLQKGSHASLKFEDIGHELDLEGYVVRIEEADDYTVYGFVITKASRDLSSYVNQKQRRNRK